MAMATSTMTAVIKEEMSSILRKFSDEKLAPGDDYSKKGNMAANEIFKALGSTGYIDRTTIAGSMGKRTAVGVNSEPDYDLVLFCNGKTPPFKPVVEEFKKILSLPKEKSGLQEAVKVEDENEMKLTVSYKGYSLDICPATNFLVDEHGKGDTKKSAEVENAVTWLVQKQKAYDIIKKANDANQQQVARDHNPGLVEAGVRFIKNQPAFVNAVIRLAKFWSNGLDSGIGKLRGRSLMIETLAVDAALGALASKEPEAGLMWLAFMEFLRKMKEIKNINCVFYVNYNENQVKADIKQQRPLVLDPSSPYDNLAKNMTPEQMKTFQAAAEVALKKMDGLRSGELNGDVQAKLTQLFKP